MQEVKIIQYKDNEYKLNQVREKQDNKLVMMAQEIERLNSELERLTADNKRKKEDCIKLEKQIIQDRQKIIAKEEDLRQLKLIVENEKQRH